MLYIIIASVILLIIFTVVIFFAIRNSGKSKGASQDYYSRSRIDQDTLGKKLRKIFSGRSMEESSFEELEEVLIRADIGPKLSIDLIEKLRERAPKDIEEAIVILKEEIKKDLKDEPIDIKKGNLNIFLVLGVNGVGKTTSIAKIANSYLKKGFSVFLAAGDTFRAAAIEQLSKWANQLNIPIIKQKENSDPSSVVYDAIDSARSKGVDLLIIDTAGRMHTKVDLVEELKKMQRVIEKKGDLVKKNILVIDATTGQNAFEQASSFNSSVGIDGVVITKFDSLAKGGVVINIQKSLNIPFYYIGTGEKIENLEEFKKDEFIENIFS